MYYFSLSMVSPFAVVWLEAPQNFAWLADQDNNSPDKCTPHPYMGYLTEFCLADNENQQKKQQM